jgi:predicted lipid-binding transport protein (Tim44 family)
MTRRLSKLAPLLAAAVMILMVPMTADAGRLGGGRSFGSKPSFSRSAPAPSPVQRQFNQSQTRPSMPGATATSPFGRWGGMLGGFMLGGLLGSLFFGGGHGYGGPGLLDLLVVGALIFMLLRFLKSRSMAGAAAGTTGFARSSLPVDSPLPGGWGTTPAGAGAIELDSAPAPATATLPPGFDTAEFIEGAKAAYSRLQRSWDQRDLEDIRHFTTPEVWSEIKRQSDEEPQTGKTELVLVNASLLDVRTDGGRTEATVLYDVLMRESPQESQTKRVREIWHFRRETEQPGSFWLLQGIQQVET